MHDLWTNLLVNVLDSNSKTEIRTAFIQIINNMIPLDAKILEFCYNTEIMSGNEDLDYLSPIDRWDIIKHMKINPKQYSISVNNLFRLRCLTPFSRQFQPNPIGFSGQPFVIASSKVVSDNIYKVSEANELILNQGILTVALTEFGVAFIEACKKKGF